MAASVLRHRGPDEANDWSTDWAALSHRRLAITNPTGSSQPMVRAGVAMAFAGEVFDYKKGNSLSGEKHPAGDTEFILAEYLKSGITGVASLAGQFGAAFVDTNARELWLIRDRFGITPLHFATIPGGLAFATELKAVLALLDFIPAADERSIGSYLLTRMVPSPFTMYKGVFKLPPAHFLCFREAGRPEPKRYWSVPERARSTSQSKSEMIEDISHAIECAVKRQAVADAPVGCLLSGGVDSSLIAALLTKISGRAARTFVVGVPGDQSRELEDSAESARLIGTRHEEVILRPEDYADNMERLAWHRDGPLGEPEDVAMFVVARHAAASVRVLLTGEGCDELFGGYPKYRIAWANRLCGILPAWFRGHTFGAVQSVLPSGARRFRVAVRALSEPSFADRLQGWFACFTQSEVQLLWHSPPHRARAPEAQGQQSSLERMLHQDTQAWLSDNLIERCDRMLMANAVEPRLPFLDPMVVSAATRIPAGLCVSAGSGKILFREAARRMGLGAIADRRKRGFPLPIAKWMRGALRPLLIDTLGSRSSLVRLMGVHHEVDRLIRRHCDENFDESSRLWCLMSLEIWFRQVGHRPCACTASRYSPSAVNGQA
jgi:asparagine synthase (glutamine-hydrolysing)